jgi:hypothetical protein
VYTGAYGLLYTQNVLDIRHSTMFFTEHEKGVKILSQKIVKDQ